ncbi:hypothetical protein [Staphylococcus agnetis]|uniref:hypothetical protein n=1 Tax=Staphylococcus agnetis TaxID=985762 RepID=UPI00142F661E|nr:hypothetical protein [Staphylococcus agnetis]NJH83276.1 hypothetical protein [Staphylococcus agnetis]
MVKIKVKKEMTLPELIQWGWDNKIENEKFYGSLRGCVHFDNYYCIGIDEYGVVKPEETFEVEVEEEITEETIIPNMASVWTMNNKPRVTMFHECTIQDFIDDYIEYPPASNEKLMLYMVNDDRTMTLIYKNGEMVG